MLMNYARYIGYLVLEMANIPYGPPDYVEHETNSIFKSSPEWVRTERTGLTTRHSLVMLQGLQKGQESIIRFEMAGLAAIW